MKERGKPSSSPATPEELKVFISGRESKCDQCGKTLLHGSWITLVPEVGARCLACADLDDLAVNAHLRQAETNYDELLGRGCPRDLARRQVHEEVNRIAARWKQLRPESSGSQSGG
jgi:hypothetical protein